MRGIDHSPVIKVKDIGIRFAGEPAQLHQEVENALRSVKKQMVGMLSGERRESLPRASVKSGRWVFRNLSFEIRRGEVFGIIGRNGCGKTTLLKIISQVLFPTEGSIEIQGRVASLLAVGTGFHMDYTGRENVFLNGMILGLGRKEIVQQFDSIVEFSEIGDSIDMPVRTYSSGMRARLAFSVAAQLQSDIVILDEVLSVGDAGFQEKSLGVIRQMREDGRTVVLVSHSMGSILEFCDRAMLIRDGAIADIGDPADITHEYLAQFNHERAEIPISDRDDRFGSNELLITDISFETSRGGRITNPHNSEDVVIMLDYEVKSNELPNRIDVGVSIKQEDGRQLVRLSTDVSGERLICSSRRGRLSVYVPKFRLVRGTYVLGFRVLCDGELADNIPDALKFDVEEGDFFGTGLSDFHSPVYFEHEWRILESEKDPSQTS